MTCSSKIVLYHSTILPSLGECATGRFFREDIYGSFYCSSISFFSFICKKSWCFRVQLAHNTGLQRVGCIVYFSFLFSLFSFLPILPPIFLLHTIYLKHFSLDVVSFLLSLHLFIFHLHLFFHLFFLLSMSGVHEKHTLSGTQWSLSLLEETIGKYV